MPSMKLIMSWDINPGKESEYFEFVVREFAPGIMRLGVQPTEAWYTVYGDRPQILTSALVADAPTAKRILSSRDWKDLHEKLMSYVHNFEQKLVPASGKPLQL